MATSTSMTGQQSTIGAKKGQFIGGIRFDRVKTIFICWFLGGLFLDGWAHNHGLVDKTFFTSFAHPFVQTELVTDASVGDGEKSWGAAAILLQASILIGVILLALRRWRLPVGSMTLVITLNIALMSVFGHQDQYKLIPVAMISGVIADLLLWRLNPSLAGPQALHLFAFAVPVAVYLNYFMAIMINNHGVAWSIHLWLGSTVMAGIVGLVLSYLLVPPQGPLHGLFFERESGTLPERAYVSSENSFSCAVVRCGA